MWKRGNVFQFLEVFNSLLWVMSNASNYFTSKWHKNSQLKSILIRHLTVWYIKRIVWINIKQSNKFKKLTIGKPRCWGPAVRKQTHDCEVVGSNARWGDHFWCTNYLDQSHPSNNRGKLTSHCCMCGNPANVRVELWLAYKIHLNN